MGLLFVVGFLGSRSDVFRLVSVLFMNLMLIDDGMLGWVLRMLMFNMLIILCWWIEGSEWEWYGEGL